MFASVAGAAFLVAASASPSPLLSFRGASSVTVRAVRPEVHLPPPPNWWSLLSTPLVLLPPEKVVRTVKRYFVCLSLTGGKVESTANFLVGMGSE